MVEWYEMLTALDNFENHPAYLEKQAVDADDEEITSTISVNKK